MPEIPEVESFKSYLSKTSLKKTITDVQFRGKKNLIQSISKTAFKKQLVGTKFSSVARHGKYLIIELSGSDEKLVMHFGLTGSLAFEKDADNEAKYAKVIFIFENGSALDWIDRRLFAKLWLVKNIDEISGIKQLGPDATLLTQKEFLNLAHAAKHKNVKVFLMDQDIIAGIGNEYSDEILFQAGINPEHSLSDLSYAQLKKMYTAMKSVLKYFIAFRKKYIAKLAGAQYFSTADISVPKIKESYLQAHRHTDGLCPKHKNHQLKIKKIGGRSAYYCPVDQK